MNFNLPRITYPTLRILLLVKIGEAIYLGGDVLVTKRMHRSASASSNSSDLGLFQVNNIVRRVPSETLLSTYRSAIALKLASRSDDSATQIAEQLAHAWRNNDTKVAGMPPNLTQLLLRNLTVTVVSPGVLEFSFNDCAIAAWLQSLIDLKDDDIERSSSEISHSDDTIDHCSPEAFFCQSTYARCCSLLRLAAPMDSYTSDGYTRDGFRLESSCWLSGNQLLLKDPAERGLLSQLIAVTDELMSGNPIEMAVELSRAFQMFDRACRIIRGSHTVDRQQLQRRLGLVMITRRLLRSLLQEKLGLHAPSAL